MPMASSSVVSSTRPISFSESLGHLLHPPTSASSSSFFASSTFGEAALEGRPGKAKPKSWIAQFILFRPLFVLCRSGGSREVSAAMRSLARNISLAVQPERSACAPKVSAFRRSAPSSMPKRCSICITSNSSRSKAVDPSSQSVDHSVPSVASSPQCSGCTANIFRASAHAKAASSLRWRKITSACVSVASASSLRVLTAGPSLLLLTAAVWLVATPLPPRGAAVVAVSLGPKSALLTKCLARATALRSRRFQASTAKALSLSAVSRLGSSEVVSATGAGVLLPEG
mmetsp:Transcript_60967/g.137683  ORF Transcript_60967/g.137683 Transcript_60967/m.137683 type:complete len:286 (+) Transcript_60967:1376-2233(+)